MRTQIGKILLALAWAMALAAPADAQGSEHKACKAGWPEPFAAGQPFLLNDPRSGLMLYVESDGRHMAAITREGKIVWQRDLFGDMKLSPRFVPPPQIDGTPDVTSDKEWQQRMRSYIGQLRIDRLDVSSDCEVSVIDHDLPANFRGHYIFVGSGTKYSWLMDAETGDLQLGPIN